MTPMMVLVAVGRLALVGATAPPSITVNANNIAECRNPTVSVWLNPRLSSSTDPLPTATFANRLASDPNGYPTNSDPDNYPLGSRNVTIKACDHASPANCASQTVSLKVRDTLPPQIQPGQNKTPQCTSPAGIPSATGYCADSCDSSCNPTSACTNPNTLTSASCQSCKSSCISTCQSDTTKVRLDKPLVVDTCDPNPTWVESTPPSIFPLGTTKVTVTAGDFTGNVSTKTVSVNVVDTRGPVFAGSVPAFNVVSHASNGASDPAYCVLGGGGNGTLVTLPHPTATDTCTPPARVSYGFKTAASSTDTPNPQVCLANGSNTVQFVARDAVGNTDTTGSTPASATTSVVTVANSFPLGIAVDTSATSRGFVPRGTVKASVSGATGSIAWALVGANAPDSAPGTGTSFTVNYSREGSYCPLYISATDGSSKAGATSPQCFGVDATAPSHTYAGVPTASTYPGGATPAFSPGQLLPLAIAAQDANGALPSGVGRVVATVVPPSGVTTKVYDNTYCSNANATAGALAVCPAQHYVAGCNQMGAALCTCQALDPATGECQTDGRLDLTQLSNGTYTMQVDVYDVAGNRQTQTYPFAVGNLPLTLGGGSSNPNSGLTAMLQLEINASGAPVAAASALRTALKYLASASGIYLESPGQAMLLARQAWNQLDQANSNGIDTSFYKAYLANVVEGEARRSLASLAAANAAGNLKIWSILGSDPAIRGVYTTRQFLTNIGGPFRDYAVNPNSTLALGQGLLSNAAQQLALGQTSGTIDASVALFDSMATLFSDTTQAAAYGYTPHTINVGTPANPNVVPEAYFRQSPASHFGSEVSATVSAQLGRFSSLASSGQLFGVPATAVTTLGQVNSSIAAFASSVSIIQNSNWSASAANFTNRRLVTEVYLNAVTALQQLQTLQSSSVYTRYWQTGIGYTLADVVNFSFYEGPTNLACLLWGQDIDGLGDSAYAGCSKLAVPGAPRIFDMTGHTVNAANVDYEAQVAECRYSRLMYGLADGRLLGGGVGALDLFVNSRCQIIDLYNRYYTPNVYIAGDTVIDPTAYGCPATPVAFTSANALSECGSCNVGGSASPDVPCNGIDDDCNGLVDDAVVLTGCGCPGLDTSIYTCPCASSSACINGQPLACIPGAPSTTVDTQCNGRDNACNGHPAAGYVPLSCGVGGCVNYSSCVSGHENACTPKPAQPETCNKLDDNCNISVDEGLDNDLDNFGCPPCQLYTSASSCNATLGCTFSGGSCQGKVGCTECIPGQAGCTTSLLCSGDVNAGGSWTGVWDCDDTDPAVFPGNPEVCDGKDNNCNGQIDEGVLNACGNCDPACTSTVIGLGGSPFQTTPLNATNIAQDPNTGAIGLTSQNLNLQYAWVANDTAGTISKMDMTTGKEAGRYCQALKTGVTTFKRGNGKDPTGAAYDTRAEPTVCAGCGGCNNGSRTAVDTSGNMYIANRAYSDNGYVGTYSKVSSTLNGCVDVDGDGVIQTSSDVNGDGVINPNQNLPAAQREYWGELDECILWTRKPTTWDRAVQPSCNDPNFPQNDFTKDPTNTSYADEQQNCTNDPNSDPGVCAWTNSCNGAGDTSCAGKSTAACNLKPTCVYSGTCGGVNGCSGITDQGTCNYYRGYCSWTPSCQPVACSTQNSSKPKCQAMPGCSWYQDCYNIGDGPFTNVAMAMPRSMSIDSRGDAWVGLFNRRGFMQVNTTNGYVKRWAYTGYQPYGSSLDRNGILWHGDSCCTSQYLAGLNTNPNTVVYTNPDTNRATFTWAPYGTQASGTVSPGGSYGVATDKRGYVYIGSYGSQSAAAYRFDALRNTWTTIPSSTDSSGNILPNAGYGRGTAVDASGNIWVAQMGLATGGRLTGFNPNTLKPIVDVNFGTTGNIPIGVGVGYAGRIWTSNQQSYNVSVVDPTTGSVGYYPVGGPPYCYSDFTGAVLRTFTSPTGSYSELISACYGFPVNSFFNLTWNGLLPVGTQNQGKASSLTRLQFRVRGAATLVTKDGSGNPVDPIANSTWTYWYPDDITNPSKNASDTSRVYYYETVPGAPVPSSGPCAGQVSSSFSAPLNTYSLNGCGDLSAMPTNYTFNASSGSQPIAYLQVQAFLVSDLDNTVQPTLNTFQVSRLCPQL